MDKTFKKNHSGPTKDQTRLIESLCDQLGIPEIFPQTKHAASEAIQYLLGKVKIQQIQDAEARSWGYDCGDGGFFDEYDYEHEYDYEYDDQ